MWIHSKIILLNQSSSSKDFRATRYSASQVLGAIVACFFGVHDTGAPNEVCTWPVLECLSRFAAMSASAYEHSRSSGVFWYNITWPTVPSR